VENQEKEKLGRFFFRTLQKLISHKSSVDQRLIDYQFDVFQNVIIDLTGSEKLLFNTLFARIAYLGIQLKLDSAFLFELHLYRKEYHNMQIFESKTQIFQLGLYLMSSLLENHYGIKLPKAIKMEVDKPPFERKEPRLNRYEQGMKGMIVHYDAARQVFHFIPQQHPDQLWYVALNQLDLFQSTIILLKEWDENGELPVHVYLREIGIDKQHFLYPKWIVLEPDYLVDVTGIAECFAPSGARPEYYLLNKLLPKEGSKFLLIGQLVNHLLDEMLHFPDLDFQEKLKDFFQIAPISFTLMDNKELVEVIQQVKLHYTNLKRVISQDFPGLGLDVQRCIVEPSFYAPELGLQGRLDVLQHQNEREYSIIELKSGSPFRENRYGLSSNHYTQTLLYDLMIRSVYKMKAKPLNYILYSKLAHQNLRFAPTIQAAQMEAISIRNEIYGYERQLIQSSSDPSLFSKLSLQHFPGAYGFIRADIEKFEKVYQDLDDLEKAYYHEMVAFIAREHHLAKTGLFNHQENNGLASLWLEDIEQKKDRFAVYSDLVIADNQSMKDPPLIRLTRNPKNQQLANFRVGDIVVLRPMKENVQKGLREQVIRASLIELNADSLVIKLRSRQYDQSFFNKFDTWRMEADFLDSGFRKMYESLFHFISAPKPLRSIILGKRPPEKQEVQSVKTNFDLTANQKDVLDKLLASKDYFLLWGPPGTGKTSVMLAAAVVHYLTQTEKDLLLLAYTNRAVDEICAMLEKLNIPEAIYLRIGSRYATGEKYRNRLLDHQLKEHHTRATFSEKVKSTRVFTGTLSSLSGKMDLFKLKKFDLVFIDEASQILEPSIVGILPLFEKFVLIGDHKQLPAVVVQSEEKSVFNSGILHELGIVNGRTAFFDRLYNRCLTENWEWLTGQLFEQGRMHESIMAFPSEVFYGGMLKTIEAKNTRLNSKDKIYDKGDALDDLQKRRIFIDVAGDPDFVLAKNNPQESQIILKLLRRMKKLSDGSENKEALSIGIITPFRAQIAQIREDMIEGGLVPEEYTIDTVERYQGGARDVIIYSTAVNSEKRFHQIQANDENGIDRKLNVAVTRAKQQFILLGNKTILHQNGLYRRLIEMCEEINI
jgi:DNA replication ATP-dependent helicase Dna2